MPISEQWGNPLTINTKGKVNPVSCDLVFSTNINKAFANTYSGYEDNCKGYLQAFRPGFVHGFSFRPRQGGLHGQSPLAIMSRPSTEKAQYIFSVPNRLHYKDEPSSIIVGASLQSLILPIKSLNIKTLAIPSTLLHTDESDTYILETMLEDLAHAIPDTDIVLCRFNDAMLAGGSEPLEGDGNNIIYLGNDVTTNIPD